ncbi:MAG: hypothetical protein ACYTHJ_05560 [Planctomycetota bacterium]|jgi:hypothetical protein
MKRAFRQCLVLGVIVAVLPSVALAVPGVVTMEVVEIDGAPITPSTNVNVDIGQQVTVEVYLEGWTPELLGFYQVLVDDISNDGGSPLWIAPVPCATAADCPNTASCSEGFCQCEESIFIDSSLLDYVFFNRVTIDASACTDEDSFSFGGILFGPGIADSGARKYLGSTILEVGPEACGSHTLAFDASNPAQGTNIRTPDSVLIDLTATATLNINVGTECVAGCSSIVTALPPDCEVDAGQPHPVDDAGAEQGLTSIEITLGGAACSSASVGVDDFGVVQIPFDILNLPPTIVSVTPSDEDSVIVELSGPINTESWTCFNLTDFPDQRTCVGYLSSDANASGLADGDDITAWIAAVEGDAPRPAWSTDIDRSGTTEPDDLLRLIDVLNGGGEYEVGFGTTLPACPGT